MTKQPRLMAPRGRAATPARSGLGASVSLAQAAGMAELSGCFGSASVTIVAMFECWVLRAVPARIRATASARMSETFPEHHLMAHQSRPIAQLCALVSGDRTCAPRLPQQPAGTLPGSTSTPVLMADAYDSGSRFRTFTSTNALHRPFAGQAASDEWSAALSPSYFVTALLSGPSLAQTRASGGGRPWAPALAIADPPSTARAADDQANPPLLASPLAMPGLEAPSLGGNAEGGATVGAGASAADSMAAVLAWRHASRLAAAPADRSNSRNMRVTCLTAS